MPYIAQDARAELDTHINALSDSILKLHKGYGYDGAFLGLVNYSVTRMVTRIILNGFERLRYWHSPAIRGTMQDIGDELYRRVFIPYEDEQILKNGDVPEYQKLLKDNGLQELIRGSVISFEGFGGNHEAEDDFDGFGG